GEYDPVDPLADRVRRLGLLLRLLLARTLELAAQLVRLARALAQERVRLTRGDGLDAARARTDGALAEDDERADLRRRADVGAAAQLHRPAADVDDAHDVAVLLAEQHHRSELPRLGDRRLVGAHRQVLEHALVHAPFHFCPLFRRQRLRMGEVEPELVGTNRGAR